MQKLIILAAVVACGFAAPVENDNSARLSRPSPINPDIPSDPKPEERVVLISTEKPLVENPAIQPLGPYALPGPTKRFLKRENKDSSSSFSDEGDSSEEAKKPATTVLKPISHPLPSASVEEKPLATQSSGTPAEDLSKTTSTASPHRKPYAPKIHQHNEHLFRPTTEAASPAVVPAVALNDKRDIPVASPQKVDSDAAKASPKEEVKQDAAPKPELPQSSHPATISRPIPVAELFAKKPSTPSTAATE